MKILVAGFQHETNTFAPSRATYGEFVKGEGWPAIKRGAEVLSLRHANVPIAGFLAAMEPAGHALVTVLCGRRPIRPARSRKTRSSGSRARSSRPAADTIPMPSTSICTVPW